jgi:hypothetical protein
MVSSISTQCSQARFFTAAPAAQKPGHGVAEMPVGAVERLVELAEEEAIVADHPPHAEQHVAERRALPVALDVGVLRQQLAEQGGPGARQAGHADKSGVHEGPLRWFSRRALCGFFGGRQPHCAPAKNGLDNSRHFW